MFVRHIETKVAKILEIGGLDTSLEEHSGLLDHRPNITPNDIAIFPLYNIANSIRNQFFIV